MPCSNSQRWLQREALRESDAKALTIEYAYFLSTSLTLEETVLRKPKLYVRDICLVAKRK